MIVSSEEVMEVVPTAADGGGEKLQRQRRRRKDADEGVDGNGHGLAMWESFLPKIALRVLLVEADDSTRQIIAALLRKCSYRVVAVSDGLKALDILKGRPESVDLILTEVDLPSVSGYSLLTLIMEHDICKNIPVIMMSTQDSVSTVYKCMLRGAADYLVKPLRRNELRNLWQHAWRRQRTLAVEVSPPDESVGQQQLEATSENNPTSNHRNATERDEELVVICKGSDAQSSCTRPELGGESVDVENIRRDLSQTCREAIDFMGAPLRRNEERNGEEHADRHEYQLELDLSLKRSNAHELHFTAELPGLCPSNASAFARYVHRPLHAVPDQRQCVAANQNDISLGEQPRSAARDDQTTVYNRANAPGPPRSIAETSPWLYQSSYPTPIPVKGVEFSSLNSGYASTMAPVVVAQSSPSPTPSLSSVSPHEYSSRIHPFPQPVLENGTPEDCWQDRDSYVNCSTSPNMAMQQFDTVEDRRYVSSVGVCHRVHHTSASGCTSNADQQIEKMSGDGFGKLQRSLQREAALTKFRMKRKERCFEKKVRYESRKKLAEQRPRVKGQFVRQGQVSDM